LGCAGQDIWHWRDHLAAHYPALKPHLVAACEPLRCSISPLRKLDALTVEGVSVSPVGGGTSYRLNLTLRNGAQVPVATPAVELSLQDSNDVTIIKRVIQANELQLAGPLSQELPAQTEHAVTNLFAIGSSADAPLKRVAGYRVVAFYP
jgi:hypothetical protein